MREACVHTYFTDGFYDLGKLFLRSYEATQYRDTRLPVVLDTRNLEQNQINSLFDEFECLLEVRNRKLNLKDIAKDLGCSVREVERMKRSIEGKYVEEWNRCWKLKTAGDDRVKALFRLLFRDGQHEPFSTVYHFDADTLFRKDIRELKEALAGKDIVLKLREKVNPVKARITIDCIAARSNKRVFDFFAEWIEVIDSVPLAERPIGFGQSSCWEAFYRMSNMLNYAKTPLSFGLPGRNGEGNVVWNGNVHRLEKSSCVSFFTNELERIERR